MASVAWRCPDIQTTIEPIEYRRLFRHIRDGTNARVLCTKRSRPAGIVPAGIVGKRQVTCLHTSPAHLKSEV